MVKVNKEIDPIKSMQLAMPALISRSATVLLTNLIPLYGVWHFGWSSFTLILFCIAEGVIVFLMDLIKRPYVKNKEQKNILVFEFVFIFFFGFFAILIFGRDENSSDLLETIRTSFQAARILPLWPIVSVLVMRLIRTGEELLAAGVLGGAGRQPLFLGGGGWMLLLFFLVLTAPFIADKSPNPTAGLIAIIVFKTLGELFAVWAHRIK